jgi:hypothetical protein
MLDKMEQILGAIHPSGAKFAPCCPALIPHLTIPYFTVIPLFSRYTNGKGPEKRTPTTQGKLRRLSKWHATDTVKV